MVKGEDSCVEPAKGLILNESEETEPTASPAREVLKMVATVGKSAPDFEVSAFVGEGFENVRLSDFRGKWVVLCFYPGDFTFV